MAASGSKAICLDSLILKTPTLMVVPGEKKKKKKKKKKKDQPTRLETESSPEMIQYLIAMRVSYY